MKGNVKKVRRLYNDKVIAGFAGGTADAFTLFELFERKLEMHQGHLVKAAVELARLLTDWPAQYRPGSTFVDAVGNDIPVSSVKSLASADFENTPSLSMQIQGICPYGWHIANMSDWKDLIYAVAESSKSYSDYPVAAATASYGAMTSGNAANVAAHLRCKEWQDAEFNPATVISNGAEAFAFNLYPQGWRLYKSGYDYCANSGNVRFYCLIPMMGQTTASKMALWRAYCTTSADMVFDDGFDVGNGSGAAVRCVKNYENF